MLENGREPLALGRRRRLASRAQKRALLRRDGGCARPGCPEHRIERLHHHMRHWLYGGRTDLANLVLLCDADHGLVHDLDLVLSRRGGALIVLDREGRRVWGRTDAVFTDGLPDQPCPTTPRSSSACTRSTTSPAGGPPRRRSGCADAGAPDPAAPPAPPSAAWTSPGWSFRTANPPTCPPPSNPAANG